MTALHLAAKYGNFKATQIIVDFYRQTLSSCKFKNFINQLDEGHWTALVWAAEHGHSEIVRYLINSDADANICDTENNTALHWAALSNSLDTVMPLLQSNCDFNIQNINGDTPLHISCRHMNTHICLIFLAHGADLKIRNKLKELPYDCIVDETSLCAKTLQFNTRIRQLIDVSEKKILVK